MKQRLNEKFLKVCHMRDENGNRQNIDLHFSLSASTKVEPILVKKSDPYAAAKQALLTETLEAVSQVSTPKGSVLSVQENTALVEKPLFTQALQEMNMRVPFLFEYLINCSD